MNILLLDEKIVQYNFLKLLKTEQNLPKARLTRLETVVCTQNPNRSVLLQDQTVMKTDIFIVGGNSVCAYNFTQYDCTQGLCRSLEHPLYLYNLHGKWEMGAAIYHFCRC